MTKLSVNLNKIALIRNSRAGNYPDVVSHARICIDAGAHGITVHPRPDQRHIRPDDVMVLAELCRANPAIEFNVEGNPFAGPGEHPVAGQRYPGFISLVEATCPDQCTLVPDNDTQLTSDHGFNLERDGERLAPVIAQLKDKGIRVSLFMDPDPQQISLAGEVGADRIELYTGPYAAAWGSERLETVFEQHRQAAEHANRLGLGVNAGHDLNLQNLGKYATIPDLLEVSIGHAMTVDALAMGLANAVSAYLAILSNTGNSGTATD